MKDWDKYFFNICGAVANNSKCMSRRIGAIIVIDNSVISMGYNGPPRDVSHCNVRYIKDETLKNYMVTNHPDIFKKIGSIDDFCPRKLMGYKSGEGLEWCIAQHAETNSIINAARQGISTKGAKMYMNCNLPCKNCLGAIINAGIKEIIITNSDHYDETSKFIIEESELKIREFDLH